MSKRALRLHDYLDAYAHSQPDGEFAICGESGVSYREAQEQANRLAHGMATRLQKGDRILLLCKNSIEMVLLYHGASKAGVVPVPLNYRLTPTEWSFIAADVNPSLVFCDAEFTQRLGAVCHELPKEPQFVTLNGGSGGWVHVDQWVEESPTVFPNLSIGEQDDAIQMYTSGTTGEPKGAVLTHGAVTASVAQVAPLAELAVGERFLLATPLYHAAGLITMLSCIASGGALWMQRDFHAADLVRALGRERIASTMVVPAMLKKCLQEVPGIRQEQFAHLRMIIYGGSPIDLSVLRDAMQAFGCDFAQRYGTTETLSISWLSAAAHRQAVTDRPDLLVSAGRPLPSTEVRVVDENGEELPQGDRGQLVVRGPQLMRGYWNAPELTAVVMRNGWLQTGDVGYIDAEGYLYICDRVKDMIVSGGENVYPREIEDVLQLHPDVAEAAVIGVPDPQWGETVRALVVLRAAATATAGQLIEFCRSHLAGFKLPRAIDMVTELPRGPTGKVLKRELREPYWRGHDRRI